MGGPSSERPDARGRRRALLALLLWAWAVGGLSLLGQLLSVHLASDFELVEALAGFWIELEVGVPAVLALGIAVAASIVLTPPGVRARRVRSPRPRLWLVPVALAAPLLWAVFAFWPAPTATKRRHPDIIVLMIDTLRRDFVDARRTPNLHALGLSSKVFDDAVSASSWTRPAVGSMLTGLHVEAHGADEMKPIRADVPTLAQHLRDAGYQTTAIVSNPQLSPKSGLPRGFDYHAHIVTWDVPYLLSSAFVYTTDAAPARLQWRRASLQARFLRDPGRPWFLFLHFMDPHHPLRPSDAWRVQERRAFPEQGPKRTLYGAELRAMDREIGIFLDELRRDGQYDDSVIAMLSDHGEEIEDGRNWSSESLATAGHGHSMLPEVIRVPLQVKLPGMTRGDRCAGTVSTRRLAATLLEVARVDHAGVFGEPLLDADGGCTREFPMTYQSGTIVGPPRSASRDGRRTITFERKSLVWRSFDRARDPAHRHPEPDVPDERRADLERHLRALGVDPSKVADAPAVDPKLTIDPRLRKQLEAMGYLRE